MAVALPFVAMGLQVMGGIQQGNAAEAQAKAQAQQLRAQADADAYNATIAQQNAGIVEGQTQAQLDQADRERRLRIGANIAAGGASGISGGSASDIIRDNITQETLNLLTIENEGLLRKREFETQGNLLTASSQNTRGQASYVRSAGKTSKANAILGGVSSAIGTGSNMGAFGSAKPSTFTSPRTGEVVTWR